MNLRSGKRLFLRRWHQRQDDFQAFLELIHRHYRGRHIALLLDENSSHAAKESLRLAHDLRIELLWLPKRAPELNPMALAIRYDGLLWDGVVRDQTELAKMAHVTQPRMTQILNLLYLARDIQEQILFLPRLMAGKDPVHEKMLRPIAAEVDWGRQREMWAGVKSNRR